MQDLIREHDREIPPAHTQTSAVSEHDYNNGHPPLWNEVTFIDRDPHSFTRRVKESIHVRIHSDNIDRDGEIEIPEAWDTECFDQKVMGYGILRPLMGPLSFRILSFRKFLESYAACGVCITFSNSPNLLSCSDESMLTRKKGSPLLKQ